MDDMIFFDANCRIGNACDAPGASAAELIREMDRYGVDRALVRHSGIADGALCSNRYLTEMLRADTSGRLTGVWCILPDACDEQPEPEEFFRQMAAAKIGALTLDPFAHRYVPCRLTLKKIMAAAAARKVPVLLNSFAGKFTELYRFVEEFPDNTLIYAENVGKWGSDRNLRPLLENFPEFYMDIAGYWVPEGIRDLAEKYGTDRILFGSGFPRYNQGCGMLQLKHCGLPDEAVSAIAGKNLQNLLGRAQL